MADNSFKRMIESKMIKRTDKGMFIALDHLHIDPGFNKRREGERLDASIRELANFLIDEKAVERGEKKLKDLSEVLPQIEVYPHPVSGVIAVEGHRRKRALALLQSEGYPIPMVPIKPFTGNELERKARIVTSNSQLPLEPLELADVYMDLEAEGLSQEQIAKLVNKTRQHVEQMLLLGRAGDEVKQQIADGVVSAGTAVGIVRQHQDNAAEVIRQEHAKAQAMGKKKVTNSTLKKAPALPRALTEDVVVAATRLAGEVPPDARELLERYRAGETALGDQTVPITIRALNALVTTMGHVNDVQAEQARKAAEKAQEAVE